MRQIKFLAILIATMVTIFSCQKNNELSIDSRVQTLTAYAPGSGNVEETPNSKVGLTESASGNIELDWQVDDVITIYNATSSNKVGNWKVTSVADDGKASFAKVDGSNLVEGVDYTAVYPASTAATLSDRYGESVGTSTQTANNNIDHLDDNLRMSSSSFQIGSTMSFGHQMAIMSVTFESSEIPTVAKIALQGESYTTNLVGFSAGVSTVHFILPSSNGDRVVEFTVNDKEENKVTKSTTAQFKQGKRYTWNTVAPTGLMLADIDADNIPEGDTWTIVDTDATAGSSDNFLGLCAALSKLETTSTINLVFPNLNTLPTAAIYGVRSGCMITIDAPELITIENQALYNTSITSISAPKVTTIRSMALGATLIENVTFENAHTIGDEAFAYSSNFKEIKLPKLTNTSGQKLFINSSNIEAITVATEGRVEFASWNQIFLGLDMSKVTLTSHISNLNVTDKKYIYKEYTYQDNWEVGPFLAVIPIGEIEVIKVTGVTLDETTLTLDKGTSKTLVATVVPDNAANKNVTWKSDNDAVATVVDGAVTGQGAGTTIITVTTEDGNITATCEVTVAEAVIEVTDVEITGYSPLNFDTPSSTPTRQLTAVLTPNNADNKEVKWKSMDETVATVDANGLVTAKGAGYTEIIANTDDGPLDKVNFKVTGNNGHYDVVLNEYDDIIEYLIYSAQGLVVFKKQTENLTTHYTRSYDATLQNNIDMSSIADWTPIFRYQDYATFDGGGYTISNLKSTEGGLFNTILNGAIIKNLTISAPNIKGTINNLAIGAIAGTLFGSKVENCAVISGTVEGIYHTGGVVGYAGGGKIYGSYSTASVRGGDAAGGLVGVIDGSNVAASYSTGSVSAASDAGGCIGRYADVGTCQVDGCFTISKVYSDTEHSLGSGGAFGFTNLYQPNFSQGCYWVDSAADDDAEEIAVSFTFDEEYYALYEVTASELNTAEVIAVMNAAISNAIICGEEIPANVPYRFKVGSSYPTIYIP